MIFNAYSDTNKGIMGISVKSSGHIFAQHGRTIERPNGRDDWLLFYVAKERERFYFNEEVDAEAGAFVFFRPFERQKHTYLGYKTGEFYYVHFIAPDDFDLFGFETSVVYQAKPSTKICDLFEEIIRELQTKQSSYEKVCASKFFNIMSLLERRIINQSKPHQSYNDKIAFILQLMNKEYEKNYSLDDYAELCRMSKFHFLRVFESITGHTPIEHRNNIRIEHAKELLEDTCMPVNEIGTSVGYSSSTYFCDAFKKKTGLSPKQYREMRITLS